MLRPRTVFIALGAVLFHLLWLGASQTVAQTNQWVEGFDEVIFHYDADRGRPSRDFRGTVRGYMTAAWWAPGQMKSNVVIWKTAPVPAKVNTTFAFIGATSILPSEFARGPSARLSVNDQAVLTFTLGMARDSTWQEGDYQLKYLSKRIEYPYFGVSRQGELNGNSGIFQLSLAAGLVEAGKPVVVKIEILPHPAWNNGWFMVKERRDVLSPAPETLSGEIDALRKDLAILNEQNHILATKLYPELLNAGRKLEHQVVYGDGFKHLHPADLVALRNGDLLMFTREGTEHYSADGDVIMLRSRDQGHSWGEKKVVANNPELDEREGCGVQLRDGTIVVGVYYNGNYNPDGSYGLKKREPGKQYLGAHIITSRDNGQTWSAPHPIDIRGMPFTGIEGPTDAPIEMPDGSIIMGIIGYRLHGDARNNGAVLLRSADQGNTWTYVSTIASDPGGVMGGFLEPGLVRTKSGRVVAGLRTPGADNAVHITYSDDDGKTWAAVRKTDMRGHPVDLIQLSDGRVMATYGVRPPQHDLPGGIRACFSADNGETWDIRTEIQLRNDFLNWDVGYPESVELPDKRILTVYYYNLFGRYFIGGTSWKP